LVKRKPGSLFCKHFAEVEIELRRKIMVVFHAPAQKNGTLPSRNHCTQAKANRTKDTIPKIKPTTITEPQVSNLALNT
jgi:hypothetical protein